MKTTMLRLGLLLAMAATMGDAGPMRRYGAQTTELFTLLDTGGVDFATAANCASSDVKISKNGAAFANTTNCFNPISGTQGGFSLVLTPTEMQASSVIVTIRDQTAPKVWADERLVFETYGDPSALHAVDLDSEAFRISLSAMVPGTVDNSTFTPTTTGFEAADVTIPTTSRLNGRIVCFGLSSTNYGECRAISAYSLQGGKGRFTTAAFTQAPSNGDKFVVL